MIEQGKTTAALPGRVLRRPGSAAGRESGATAAPARHPRYGENREAHESLVIPSGTKPRSPARIAEIRLDRPRRPCLFHARAAKPSCPPKPTATASCYPCPTARSSSRAKTSARSFPVSGPRPNGPRDVGEAQAARIRGAVRGRVVGARKRIDQRSGRPRCASFITSTRSTRRSRAWPGSRPARSAVPRPRFRRAFKRHLASRCSVARGPHVILLHQHSEPRRASASRCWKA